MSDELPFKEGENDRIAFTPTIKDIREAASFCTFGQHLIQNNFRSVVVEAMVERALAPNWHRCSGDWQGWDFERSTGARLEVKQSAVLQTWASPKVASPKWDIAERKGFYKGAVWTVCSGRQADIYVFGLHSTIDETADHRDATQWAFYVVRSSALPDQKMIGLAALKKLAEPVAWDKLFEAVEGKRQMLIDNGVISVTFSASNASSPLRLL